MYFPAPPRPAGVNRRPAGTGRCSGLRTRRPGQNPGHDPCRDHPVRDSGGGSLEPGAPSGWPAAPDGRTTTASCPSSRAPSFAWPSITCPATAAPNRCGCGATAPGLSADAVDRTWQAFLRRFDIEHTFRFFKQVLGWTRPKLRDPAAADRWTWLIIAAYAQLWLARGLASADIRLPWQRPCPPGLLTPPGFAGGSATSARCCPAWPARRNPASPAPDARPAREPPPSYPHVARPSSETSPRRKPQAGRLNNKLRA